MTVSSVTIINSIWTMIYDEFMKINSISDSVANEYSNLNLVLFAVLLDECLSSNILASLDYCHRIYLNLSELFTMSSMIYNLSLLCEIKSYQLSMSSV
jgi:hypothetical protein